MTYKRPDLAVKIGLKGQRGYTMKDIGFLDQRISQLEYYTVLNALTQDTQSLSITNADTGLERFKNGIFADPFNDNALMRTDDPELSIGFSSRNSIARPNFSEIYSEFTLDNVNSSGVQSTGKLLTLSYTSEFLDGNEVATDVVNCTGNFYKFAGTGTLYPNHYMGVDRENEVPQNITIDNTIGFNALIATGKWKNIDNIQGNPIVVGTSTTLSSGGRTVSTDYTRTDTTKITDLAVTQTQTSTFINDNVVDVSNLPFIKSIRVAFVATGLKPNTRFYPFFDGTSVTSYCAPGTVNTNYADGNGRINPTLVNNLADDQEYKVLDQNGNFGNNLVSDSNGNLYVIFLIPSNTFKVGDRVFTVIDTDNLKSTLGITSQASAIFTSATLGLTKQTSTFNIVNPTTIAPVINTIVTDPISWSTSTYIPDPPRERGNYSSGGRDSNPNPSGSDHPTADSSTAYYGGGGGSGPAATPGVERGTTGAPTESNNAGNWSGYNSRSTTAVDPGAGRSGFSTMPMSAAPSFVTEYGGGTWSRPSNNNETLTRSMSTVSSGGNAANPPSNGGSGGGGKIVCTAMNTTYGFGSFRNSIWLKHSLNNMTKEHEVGYHTIFLPLVNYAYYSGDLTTGKKLTRHVLEFIARHRTADIWNTSRNKKRDFYGMILRSILEPTCYAVGWIKLKLQGK
jgi:hypothetical protein